MIEMKFHEDKAMKMIAQSLGEAVVAFLHIDKKIKEVGPTELTIPDADSMNMDYTYLMEDETYLHIEFQTTYKDESGVLLRTKVKKILVAWGWLQVFLDFTGEVAT